MLSSWASPFVDPENEQDGTAPHQSGRSGYSLGRLADKSLAECLEKANKLAEGARVNLIRAVVLFVVSWWPALPNAVNLVGVPRCARFSPD